MEDALVALQGNRERLQRLQAAADAAANAALMAQQRYASGLIDFATVLETQRTQLSAQDSVATTVASVADHVRLYKALGGGWHIARRFWRLPAGAVWRRPRALYLVVLILDP